MALKLSVEGRTKFLRCKISLSYVILGKKSKDIVDMSPMHISLSVLKIWLRHKLDVRIVCNFISPHEFV